MVGLLEGLDPSHLRKGHDIGELGVRWAMEKLHKVERLLLGLVLFVDSAQRDACFSIEPIRKQSFRVPWDVDTGDHYVRLK